MTQDRKLLLFKRVDVKLSILRRMTSATPQYKLSFEERRDYLYAVIRSDRMNEKIARTYLSEIAEKVKKIRANRVMIVRDVHVMLPDGDLFSTTNFFLDKMRGKFVAFVNPHIKISDDMEFAIRIGTNRGGLYGLFHSEKEAEEWLLETRGDTVLQIELEDIVE